MIIVGAGMAGCLAGVLNPNARIIEKSEEFNQTHDAVLRFRTDSISKHIGIPFKKVIVHKAIWVKDTFYAPNPALCNLYSLKVSDRIDDHSIWNCNTVERYIAPSNFHSILEELCHNRIEYDHQIDVHRVNETLISTIPMSVMYGLLGAQFNKETDFDTHPLFTHKPIYVNRFKIHECNVHQTIYYPDRSLHMYRATLTGNNLIVESMKPLITRDTHALLASFRIIDLGDQIVENHVQKYGKIEPINNEWRKAFMYWLSNKYYIYSLGRFATWRNILLDDVLKDIFKIRELIMMNSYDKMRMTYES